jgi:hypothetical protein
MKALFKAQMFGGNPCDATGDGQRFLIGHRGGNAVDPPTLILNWPAMLKR